MDFQINHCDVFTQAADCLVLSVYQGGTQSQVVQEFDKLTNNTLTNLLKSGDFKAKVGDTLVLFHIENIAAKKVLLVGIGEQINATTDKLATITKSIANQLASLNSQHVLVSLEHVAKEESYRYIRHFIELINYHCYQFNDYKTTKSPSLVTKKISLVVDQADCQLEAQQGLKHGIAISNAIKATRTLANQPSNVCNAQYLADKAGKLDDQFPTLTTSYYDESALAKLGMNAYLAVGQGSKNESIMTVMEYHGAKDKHAAPIVLVGKGLTFDSGGISIKPAAGMDEMKYDMCGAATVYGVMQAISELHLPINVVGVMAGCENMPGSGAYRPGDILTTLSGQTVEVINTDAEGRLVLCDVLTFVERFKPTAVIDIATLTGACIVALGHHYTGIMGNDDALVNELVSASNKAHDKAWQLPLDGDFQEQIKSTCADIVNSAGRDGGTITAGCFLSRFTQKYRWAHLDIAGTAWVSGAKKGATGRPVAMLIEYLLSKSC
ncbi:aminopeptidase A [Orbus hercynius]|uniref:Probable cytosol aminopeptidase n=1 Tax=Orbus hercynius TaxID=593135 RepID=A0A495RJH7_9GAMM|nr:leucyl aminopeptidase [Orbus hercynius]RKS87519.1 aminopeptidase A [Orbus hercynius]